MRTTFPDFGPVLESAKRRRGAVALLVFSCVALAMIAPNSARAAAAVAFAPAQAIDAPNPLHAVSCPSTSLCVVTGAMSHVLVSSDPAGSNYAKVTMPGAGQSINGVSCPTSLFCVAVDGAGNAYVSSAPGAATAASWTEIPNVDGNGAALESVSCPSSTACVAAGYDGALVSSDAGAHWTLVTGTSSEHLTGVSCPTVNLCVAVADSTTALTISALGAGAGASVITAPNADSVSGDRFTGVACPSSALCVAVDNVGWAPASTDPAGAVWDPVAGAGYGHAIGGVDCPVVALCLAVNAGGSAAFSTDPQSGPSAIWSLDGTTVDMSPLNAIACPQSGFCVAVDQNGGVSLGTGARIAVSLAGAGSGSVSDSGGYISCGLTCGAYYAARSTATLSASSGPGSTFVGWSGACSGTGSCTITNGEAGSSQTVTATFKPPATVTKLTKATLNRYAHTARFVFSATNSPTGFECELLKREFTPRLRAPAKPKQTPPVTYHPCRSPKVYRHLTRGAYTFYVYAVGPGGTAPTPASYPFGLKK